MARIYKLKVPNENMISRIISSENQAHEIMVIDRSDKAFINTYIEKLEKPALYILVNRETDKLPDDWQDENGNKYPTEWWKS